MESPDNSFPPAPRRTQNLLFAVLMIAAGILLFLANLGLFPLHRVWDFWPLIFCVPGLSTLERRRTRGSVLIGSVFICIGIVATLFNTGVLHGRAHDDSWPLSLLFIGLGVVGLAKVLDGENWTFGHVRFRRDKRGRRYQFRARIDPFPGFNSSPDGQPINPEPGGDVILNDYTMMGHIKRKVETPSFCGGRLTSIMGNIEIDLRRAGMPEGRRSAHLEVNAMMGHIALRVPDTWRVTWTGENILGSFEDKTIPPNTGGEAPQLVLFGACTMGAIEIES